MSDTGESLFSCERCGADRFGNRIQERRLIFEVAYLCWSCYRIASEDEALLRACCDVDAMVYSGRKMAERNATGSASAIFYDARQKSIAAVKAFLMSGRKQVEP